MLIKYFFGAESFSIDDKEYCNYNINDGNGDIVFELENAKFKVLIDHLIHINLFYRYNRDHVLVSTDIKKLTDNHSPKFEILQIIERKEFLPHSLTAFEEVYIFNSFLHYTLVENRFSITLSPKALLYEDLYQISNVNDLKRKFLESFSNLLQTFPEEQKFILPLSGGMDSRLLLNLFLTERKAKFLKLFTVGIENSGDIQIAKKVIKNLDLNSTHEVKYISQFTREELLQNYRKVSCLVPLDRLLHPDYTKDEGSVVISGIYGDVIFADSIENECLNYRDFCKNYNIYPYDEEDEKIMQAYSKFRPNYKLFRTLLRCQKLTKQSLIALQYPNRVLTPFLDNEIVFGVRTLKEKNIYPRFVKLVLSSKQQSIIHQSSLSTFTLPLSIRLIQRQLYKLIYPEIRTPYFNEKSLCDIGVGRHETPNVTL